MYLYYFLLCPSACNITEYWGDGVGFPWSTQIRQVGHCYFTVPDFKFPPVVTVHVTVQVSYMKVGMT